MSNKFLDGVVKALQYPQSVATGLLAGGKKYDIVNAEGQKIGVFDPAYEGFKGGLSPSKLARLQSGNEPMGAAERGLNTVFDLVIDPALVGGKAAKALGLGKSKVGGELLRGATNVGKIQGGGKIAKVGKAARLLRQGALGAYDDFGVGGAIGAASILGLGENAAVKYAPKVIAKLAKNVNVDGLDVADAVGDGISKELGEPVMARLAREAQDSEVIGAAQDAAFRKAAQLDSINSGLVPSSPVFPGRIPDQDALGTLFANLQAGRANPVRALPPGNQNVRSLFPEAVGTNNPFPFIKPRERELGRASLQPAELISMLQDPNQRTAIMRRLTSG